MIKIEEKMKLSKTELKRLCNNENIEFPKIEVFDLPERVLQFGTGVFIRGWIDYLINKANNEGVFNGRVVVVKSTDSGDIHIFKQQDNLYTLIMKSMEFGKDKEDIVVCASISRVLKASNEWESVLECAANPELQIVISNTTEVGISLSQKDTIHDTVPKSYPARLLRFLYERFKIFNGSDESGFVIVPTELITDNGTKLKAILNEIAIRDGLDSDFVAWLNISNEFCNSLVDRIVPGIPPNKERELIQKKLGYEDELMVKSETFGLWAIESKDKKSKMRLTFSKVHPQVFLVANIAKFRELKLRLLNGSHNLTCAIGFIAGFPTVKDAMANKVFNSYIVNLVQNEIAPAIVSTEISLQEAQEFGGSVLDRYRNPHIDFDWLDICVQDTSKIKIRAVPIVQKFYQKRGFVPDCISLSFAGYILFMKSEKKGNEYFGRINQMNYKIKDDFAENLYSKWRALKKKELVEAILGDKSLWGVDLASFKGFSTRVYEYVLSLDKNGFEFTVSTLIDSIKPVQN